MPTKEEIKKRIAEEEIFQAINGFASDIFISYDFKLAYGLIKDLEEIFREQPDFSKKHPRRYEQYQDIIVKAKFVALSQIREEEMINLFNEHFKEIFDLEDYNLPEMLRGILVVISVYEQRDELKQKIKQALLNNKQVITSQKLKMKIGEETKEFIPIVSNWLKEYNKEVGGGRVNRVAVARYVTGNQNIKVLDEQERKMVVKLIEFYEFLKKSSLTDEGAEEKVVIEVDGKLRLFNQGRLEELENPKIKELMKKVYEIFPRNDSRMPQERDEKIAGASVQTIKQLMQEVLIGDREEEKKIKKLESEIKDKEGSDVEKIISGLRLCLTLPLTPSAGGGNVENPPTPLIRGASADSPLIRGARGVEWAVARLRLLAKIDPKSLAMLLESGAESGETSLTLLNFQDLIQNILGKRFGLPETETARYGMQLAIILKKQNRPEFMKAIYFDKKDGVFRWNGD